MEVDERDSERGSESKLWSKGKHVIGGGGAFLSFGSLPLPKSIRGSTLQQPTAQSEYMHE